MHVQSDLTPPAPRPLYRLADLEPGQCLVVDDLTKWQSLRVQASKLNKRADRRYQVEKAEQSIRVHRIA